MLLILAIRLGTWIFYYTRLEVKNHYSLGPACQTLRTWRLNDQLIRPHLHMGPIKPSGAIVRFEAHKVLVAAVWVREVHKYGNNATSHFCVPPSILSSNVRILRCEKASEHHWPTIFHYFGQSQHHQPRLFLSKYIFPNWQDQVVMMTKFSL